MAVVGGPVACPPVVVAHQGGWDEVLMVLAPVAVLAFLLWVANRRAARLPPGPPDADGS